MTADPVLGRCAFSAIPQVLIARAGNCPPVFQTAMPQPLTDWASVREDSVSLRGAQRVWASSMNLAVMPDGLKTEMVATAHFAHSE
jgi:hypothetical protein